MSIREALIDFSRGDLMDAWWRLYALRGRARLKPLRDILTFFLNRSARRHGGYVGPGAVFLGRPSLPHGLHGVFISRYARVGSGCRIYQNVTIGEVAGKAPRIGDNCLIGAGAVIVGDIDIGDNVTIGAGAVVSTSVPDNCTVVAQAPRIIERGSLT